MVRNYKGYIEVKTNKNGWTKVELLENRGGILIIKMPDGQVIGRKSTNIRPVIKRIEGKKSSGTHDSFTRKFKTKKKRNKLKKYRVRKKRPYKKRE